MLKLNNIKGLVINHKTHTAAKISRRYHSVLPSNYRQSPSSAAIISFLYPPVATSLMESFSSGPGMPTDGRANHGAGEDSQLDQSRKFALMRPLRYRTGDESLPADEYWTDGLRWSADLPPQWHLRLRCCYVYRQQG